MFHKIKYMIQNNSLRLVAAQEKHIQLLQERLEEKKKELIKRFTTTPGWPYFIIKKFGSYNRYKQTVASFFSWIKDCRIKLMFEMDESLSIYCYKGSFASNFYFKLEDVPVDEFDEFISNSLYDDILKWKEETVNNYTSWTWSSRYNESNNENWYEIALSFLYDKSDIRSIGAEKELANQFIRGNLSI